MPTENLSTVSPGGDQGFTNNGGEYSSIVTCEASQQGKFPDLVANDMNEVWECYTMEETTAAALTIGSWTTDATRDVVVKAAAGHEHNGDRNAGFRFTYTGTGGLAWNHQSNYITSQDLVLNHTGGGTRTVLGHWNAGPQYFERLICRRVGSGRAYGQGTTNTTITLRNCVLSSTSSGHSAVQCDGRYGANAVFQSCTIINETETGVEWCIDWTGSSTDISHSFINCVLYADAYTESIDGSQGGYDGTSENTNNAYKTGNLALANDANGTFIDKTAFTDFANQDFSPVAGGALVGVGADWSGNARFPYTDDITRTARVAPWDIGAYETAAAGGVTFDGPDIIDQPQGVENEAFVFDENGEGTVASRFSVT
jgi:hypothetical protein